VPIHFQEKVEGENAINGIGAGLFKILVVQTRCSLLFTCGCCKFKEKLRGQKQERDNVRHR